VLTVGAGGVVRGELQAINKGPLAGRPFEEPRGAEAPAFRAAG
jgi:hypothetical protein